MTIDRLAYLLRRPWRDVSLPPDVVGIPTMLSKSERKLLYALARDYASEDAAIVDAGCFLGGSTAALLAGIRDRREPWKGPPMASYDLFRVEEYTIPKFFADDPSFRVGDSFRHRFEANVAGFGVPSVVHEGDIAEIGWPGGPIDIFFVDVVKTWEVNDAVLRDFFPSLVPGRSVIIHQDYGWGPMPWIPITVELMRDSLRLIDGMEWGSHVFFVEKEIPVELMEQGIRTLDHDQQLELIDSAIRRANGWVRGMIEISRAAVLAERDGREAELSELAWIAERYSDYPSVLLAVSYARGILNPAEALAPPTNRSSWRTRLDDAWRRLAGALPSSRR
jgi:hypothetical protein